MCLNRTYPKIDSITNDGSPAGYFELSAYGIPAFEVLDSLAFAYSKKPYKSKYNRNFGMMKCLDFYNSKELENAIVELDSVLDYKRIKWLPGTEFFNIGNGKHKEIDVPPENRIIQK